MFAYWGAFVTREAEVSTAAQKLAASLPAGEARSLMEESHTGAS